MRLCILKPNNEAYSETFIDRQVSFLNPEIVLFDGWQPTIVQTTFRSFLNFPFNFLLFRGIYRNLFPKSYQSFYTNHLASFLSRESIDVVLANYGPMAVMTLNACKQANVPMVVHFHGFDAHQYDTIKQYKERYRAVFDYSTAIVAVSEDMKANLIKLGASPSKIVLNPYSVNTELFSDANPEQSELIYLFVGRFVRKKSPQSLIKAFHLVLQKIPDSQLVLIGVGPLLDECKALVKNLGIIENVQFLGKQSPERVAFWMKKARAFVQHSLTAENGDMEGTPNTILEASSSSLPVISTAHAGIKEAVIHEKTGYLVEEGNWEKMAYYMIKLGEDPSLARNLGEAGKEHIRSNYSAERQLNTFKNIFNRAVS